MNITTIRSSSLSDVGLISPEVRDIINFFLLFVLCAMMCVFGMLTNILNMIIFVRQGFQDSINISLMGLAVADFMCLFTTLWISLSASPLSDILGFDFHESDVTYLTGIGPRQYFIRISSLITGFITLERCLCIAIPLKVKDIITSFKTKVIIISIFTSMLIFFIPLYSVNNLEWKYYETVNKSLLTITYTSNKVLVETITFPIYGVAIPVISFLSVSVCTIILVVQLNRKSQWRKETMSSSQSEHAKIMAVKDKKVVKMVTLVSTIFIICSSPATAIFVAMSCEPEYSITGRYRNLFYAVWSMVILTETVNSGVNIFVYYNMSSKFKSTLGSLLQSRTFGNKISD